MGLSSQLQGTIQDVDGTTCANNSREVVIQAKVDLNT